MVLLIGQKEIEGLSRRLLTRMSVYYDCEIVTQNLPTH
jgi:hypothetical protein